jgi:membrane-associated phospholipid phosphatase
MNIEKYIDYIGYYGPYGLSMLSILILIWYKLFTLLAFFCLGWGFNSLINFFLKGVIKDPRPYEDKHLHSLHRFTDKRISIDKFGMPSGHAQTAFYCTIFMWFSLKHVWITLFFLVISLNTLYQRIKYKNHTEKQVIVGSFIGAIIGFLVFYLSQKNLTGPLKKKLDDFAYVR